MRTLIVLDGDVRIAAITWIEGRVFVIARSPREWKDMQRISRGFDSGEPTFLRSLAKLLRNNDFKTRYVK